MPAIRVTAVPISTLIFLLIVGAAHADKPSQFQNLPVFQVWPVGWVRKQEGMTFIEMEKPYLEGMMGLASLEKI